MNTIYALADPRNGIIRYVGKAAKLKRRLQNHVIPSALRRIRHVAAWLKKIRSEGITPDVIVLEQIPDCGDWQEAERRWIKHYRDIGNDLCNIRDGGEGGSEKHGRKPSQAFLDAGKLASARKKGRPGRRHTPEEIEAVRQSAIKRWAAGKGIGRKGRPITPEQVEKLCAPRRGKPLTPDHRQKLRLAKLGKKQPQEMVAKRVASLKAKAAAKRGPSLAQPIIPFRDDV